MAPKIRGKPAQFDVTLKEVREARLPALDVDFAKALGVTNGDLVKMRAEVRANLEREVKKRIAARLKDQVMNVLLDVNPIVVPKALIEMESRQMADNARRDMTGRGMDVSKIPVETGWFAEQAERRVKLGLLLAELVKKHDLHAKPEQIRAQIRSPRAMRILRRLYAGITASHREWLRSKRWWLRTMLWRGCWLTPGLQDRYLR